MDNGREEAEIARQYETWIDGDVGHGRWMGEWMDGHYN